MSFDLLYRTDNANLIEHTEAFLRDWQSGMDEIPVFTSGSTGTPKKLILKRKQLESSAKRTLDYFALKPGETVVSCLSPNTIGGKMMLIRAILGNLRLIVVAPSSTPLSALQPEDQPVFCPMVPLQVQHSLETDPELLKNIRTILLGGAPISEKLEAELVALGNVHIGFGMTETVSHIGMRRAGNAVYSAMKGVSFDVGDDRLIINDQILEIQHLETNDAVRLIDSTHFEWLGRTDFVINSGGIKIHPEQLERLIAPMVTGNFFISSRPHDTFGRECILVTENSTMDLEHLQEICKKHFGPYAAPRVALVTPFIYNEGGKVNRGATLRQLGIEA